MSFENSGNLSKPGAISGLQSSEILDFSVNVNPLGYPPELSKTVASALDNILHYPERSCASLCEIAADALRVKPSQIIAGNGSAEILNAITRAFKTRKAILPVPCCRSYKTACELAEILVEDFILSPGQNFQIDFSALSKRIKSNELVIVGRPANPTGAGFDSRDLIALANAKPEALFVVDEAFIEFVPASQCRSLVAEKLPENIIVLRSMSKFYAIPGLRLGLAITADSIAKKIRAQIPPCSVNSIAQSVGKTLFDLSDYNNKSRETVLKNRAELAGKLEHTNQLLVFPSQGNFLLCELQNSKINALELREKLLQNHRILICDCDIYTGLDEYYFRVAVRNRFENARLIEALKTELNCVNAPAIKIVKPTPAIMFQGTSSNAGKSVLAAGFCRILLQDGVRVAPFKAQNLSLNSFVTPSGKEMGRAQVTQAQACKIDPDFRMNPLLLKPDSATGCQVILNGYPVSDMQTEKYFDYKKYAFEEVCKSYDSLALEYDAIVLEGAGSPAEINLMQHDIVNMKMAQYAKSPVLLVGDIDRGGVFASFVGTMQIFNFYQRNLVAGFVINRFRGDSSQLAPAINYTQELTAKPTFGVIPFIKKLGLPEEDSVEFKSQIGVVKKTDAPIDIAVVDLPHISNFTDFDPLAGEPDVSLRVVNNAAKLGNPDVIILPGSKNTIVDFKALKSSQLADAILKLSRTSSVEIVGICGGLQMLGHSINDENPLDSDASISQALMLLDIHTKMQNSKTLMQTKAKHLATKCDVTGYEIHHGLTSGNSKPAVMSRDKIIGYQNENGLVWGTYLHGIFDADLFRRCWLDEIRKRKNLAPLSEIQFVYEIETALDNLADVMRQNMQIGKIYQAMNL